MRTGLRMLIPELEMEHTYKLPGFACKLCSRCCQGKIIVLYKKDLERLKGLGGFCEATSEGERSLTGASHKMIMREGRCIFLEGGLCAHYECRPDTCRRHPFLITRKNMLVATTCPGVNWSVEGEVGEYGRLSEGIGASLDRYLSKRKAGGKGA
jgi:Fe-S-cluster containining protein